MGGGGRSTLPHLCLDPLSPTAAVLAWTHADIDLVPWPLSHQPAGLAVHKDLGRRSRMRGDAHSTLGSWDWLGVASVQVRAKASSPSRRGRWFQPLSGKTCPVTSPEGGFGEGLSQGGFCKAAPRPPVPTLLLPPSQRVCRCSRLGNSCLPESPRHSCHLDCPGGASPHHPVSLTGPKTGLNSRPANLCAKTHGGRCVLEFGIFRFRNNTSVCYIHICTHI